MHVGDLAKLFIGSCSLPGLPASTPSEGPLQCHLRRHVPRKPEFERSPPLVTYQLTTRRRGDRVHTWPIGTPPKRPPSHETRQRCIPPLGPRTDVVNMVPCDNEENADLIGTGSAHLLFEAGCHSKPLHIQQHLPPCFHSEET